MKKKIVINAESIWDKKFKFAVDANLKLKQGTEELKNIKDPVLVAEFAKKLNDEILENRKEFELLLSQQ